MIIVEVCVDSVESAVAAQEGGAARVELCANLAEGGTTPSAGMIELVRERNSIGLHIMIRPRSGNFCYSDQEFDVMKRDIDVAKNHSADGVVFGILKPNRTIDVARTGQLVALARPMKVTFHRAFDECHDQLTALDDIVRAGVDRILTSGGKPNAMEGLERIRELATQATDQVAIMAGSGVTFQNVKTILSYTGVREVHIRSTVTRAVGNAPREGSLFDLPHAVVDPQAVKKFLEVVRNG